ncbi:MAG: hypothetical protein ACLFVR_16205 [Thiohalospira sp.]
MNLINKIDRRFSIGLILGLIFGLLSVYVDFFRSSDPELSFNVLSNATVFDIKENIGELDVLYDSTSLTKQGKTISLITIKISNSGNGSILKEYFDSISPIRLYIDSAKIVQNPQLIETNEDYLNKSVSFSRISDNGFILNPFIFDRGKYFVIKFLAIHKQGFTPTIKADGKIAKIDKFEFFSSYNNQKKEPFWSTVFHGGFLIHITRFFTYIFAIVIFVILLVLPISLISDSISKKNRKRMMKIFRKVYKNPIDETHEILIDFYLDNGVEPIDRFKRIINDQGRFKHLFSLVNDENDFYFARHRHHNPMDESVGYLIRELKEKEIIKIEDKRFSIDENFKTFLLDFIKFMKE